MHSVFSTALNKTSWAWLSPSKPAAAEGAALTSLGATAQGHSEATWTPSPNTNSGQVEPSLVLFLLISCGRPDFEYLTWFHEQKALNDIKIQYKE